MAVAVAVVVASAAMATSSVLMVVMAVATVVVTVEMTVEEEAIAAGTMPAHFLESTIRKQNVRWFCNQIFARGGGRGVANCACILSWVYRRELGHTATNMRDQTRPLQPPITARQKQRILIHLGMATYQTNPYRDQGFTDRSGLAYCVSKRLQLAQMPPPTRIGLDFSMPAHSLICEKESGRHCKF